MEDAKKELAALMSRIGSDLAKAPRHPKKGVCIVCGQEFEDLGRRARRYCSDACRSKAYRERHGESVNAARKVADAAGRSRRADRAAEKRSA